MALLVSTKNLRCFSKSQQKKKRCYRKSVEKIELFFLHNIQQNIKYENNDFACNNLFFFRKITKKKKV